MCVVEVSLYIPISVGLSLNFIDSSCVQVCGVWLLHDSPLALGAGVWWPGGPALHLLRLLEIQLRQAALDPGGFTAPSSGWSCHRSDLCGKS